MLLKAKRQYKDHKDGYKSNKEIKSLEAYEEIYRTNNDIEDDENAEEIKYSYGDDEESVVIKDSTKGSYRQSFS